ncbi:MAG: GAF domain-containing protein, partial [candidate division WOR-3 bacterium]
ILPDETRQYADFTLVSGQGAEELWGLRLRAEEAVLEATLLHQTEWSYFDAQQVEPKLPGLRRGVAGLRSGCAVPLPGLPGSALVVVNRKGGLPFEADASLYLKTVALFLPFVLHIQTLQRRLERQDQERQLLQSASLLIGRELHLQSVLTNLLAILRDIEGFCGAVWFYNEEGNRLYPVDAYGIATHRQEIIPSGQWEAILAIPEVVSVPEEQIETLLGVELEVPLRSLLIAPLHSATDQKLGFLMVGSPRPDAYEEREKRLLQAIAAQAALAVSNALLHEQVARQARESALLYEVSVRLGSLNQIQEVAQLLTQSALKLIVADHAVVYLEQWKRLIPLWIEPPHPALNAHAPHPTQSLPGWIYTFNAPLSVADLSTNPHNQKEPLPADFCSALGVPLQVADQVLGVLLLLTLEPRLFTLAETELLFTLGNTCALTLANLWRAPHEPEAHP